MYVLNDEFGNLLFTFQNDGTITDRESQKVGSVINGVVCDIAGNPTRVTMEGNSIVWHGVNPGPVLTVVGSNVLDETGVTEAVIVGATSDLERMLAAAAYWEFVDSQT